MLPEDTVRVGRDIDPRDSDYDGTGAWHISSTAGTIRTSSVIRWSDPRVLELFCQSEAQNTGWRNFQSDETLQDSPELDSKLDLKSESRPASKPEPRPASKPESRPASKPQPRPVSKPELKPPQGDESSRPGTPSKQVGFWSHNLTKTRLDVLWNYFKTLLILCVFVFVVLSIYWGVLAQVYQKLESATVAVVDFDGLEPYQDVAPMVGPAVVAEAMSQLLVPRHIGYQIRPPSEFAYDPMNVRVAVHDEKYWAAIVINRNATALLQRAIETGNTSYDPLGAAQIIYNQARDVEAYNQYVIPPLMAFASDVSTKFGRNWTEAVLSNRSLDSTIYSRVPQALSPSISFSMFNLRPFDPPTAIPAVSIGLIYLIIIAFFSFGFFIPTHMKFVRPNPAAPHPPLKFYQLVAWRYVATMFAYFCLSLFYSLVSLAFQIPFSHSPPSTAGLSPRHWPKTEVVENADYLGGATFVVYWILNFVGMSALGLACENMAMLLGTPWTALWLIFWVITNVSTGFYSLELASDFYRWGYAWPLRQIVVGSRTLLFGTKNTLGLNFGILVVWTGVGTLLFPVCCWIFRWKTIREKKRLAAMQSGARPE